MKPPAIQDQMYAGMRHCFGCGADNPDGLHIKSRWDGEEIVCTWQPKPSYLGAGNYMNGGIIGTLIDCHCGCSVLSYLYKSENRAFGSTPEIQTVTVRMSVDYLAPVWMDAPVHLRARITAVEGRTIRVGCLVYSREREAARGELLFLRVRDHGADSGTGPA